MLNIKLQDNSIAQLSLHQDMPTFNTFDSQSSTFLMLQDMLTEARLIVTNKATSAYSLFVTVAGQVEHVGSLSNVPKDYKLTESALKAMIPIH